jgi:hypothetical protein
VATIFAAAPLAQKETDKKQQEKLEQAQRAEAQALVALVDDLAAGKPAASGIAFKWEQAHFIKAQGEKTYVPFTIAFEPGTLTAPGVGLYLRVSKAGAAAAAPAPPPAEGKKDEEKKPEEKKPEASPHVFEDLFFFDVPAAPAGEPQRVRRAFAAAPGEYDVYLAVKERPAAGAPAGAPPKMGVLKQTLSVPDMASGQLTTSSIIVAASVDVLQAAVPEERQADNPYTFGQMRLVPALENTFSKKGELSVIFWIYGAKVDETTKKPDVNIDFKFYQKAADKETYFNKTEPQALNGQTLPPQFDLAAGHQLPGSLAVPLASFPEGDYRLEIEINDKLAGTKVTRDVPFKVLGQ